MGNFLTPVSGHTGDEVYFVTLLYDIYCGLTIGATTIVIKTLLIMTLAVTIVNDTSYNIINCWAKLT